MHEREFFSLVLGRSMVAFFVCGVEEAGKTIFVSRIETTTAASEIVIVAVGLFESLASRIILSEVCRKLEALSTRSRCRLVHERW